jgi:hypothetical protein
VYVLLGHAQWLWAGYDLRPFSLVERLMSEGRILWFYLGLMVAPRMAAFGLYHDDIAVSTGLFSPWTTLPALLGLAGLAWLAWRVRKSAPLAAFGIAWFLIGHSLESTVLPLELAHEHRNYLPLLGVCWQYHGRWLTRWMVQSTVGRQASCLRAWLWLTLPLSRGFVRTSSAMNCGVPRSKPCIIRPRPAPGMRRGSRYPTFPTRPCRNRESTLSPASTIRQPPKSIQISR